MAEREGFEPSVEFPLHTLSKRAPSTTRTSLRVFGINRLRASGSARKPNCDRNCDTPPKGLRSFTGVRALEHARRLQELLQTCRRIQGCLECGLTFGTENEVAPGPALQRRAPSARRPLVCSCSLQPQGYLGSLGGSRNALAFRGLSLAFKCLYQLTLATAGHARKALVPLIIWNLTLPLQPFSGPLTLALMVVADLN